MSNVSIWSEFSPQPFGRVTSPQQFDTVIVGGGITGLTAALLFKQQGQRVCVLEKERIGFGQTSHTSAHLTYVTDLRLSELAERFGEHNATLAWRAGASAIDLIEQIVNEQNINCGFHRVPGFLYTPVDCSDDEVIALKDEQDLASKLGFECEFQIAGPIGARPAVRYANQGLFHPMRYLDGIARAVHGQGSMIFEHAEVAEFKVEPVSVVVNGHSITADRIFVATHVPLVGLTSAVSATLFQTKLFPFSSYVLHAFVPNTSLQPGLFSDTADPYNYLRIHDEDGRRHAIFGGEDHKTGQVQNTDACFARLEAKLLRLFPAASVRQRWSGQVVETADGLPFIGESAPNQFVATGFAGNGLTFGTVGAMMARDWAANTPNVCTELFDPNRKNLAGLAHAVREGADFPAYLVGDRMHPHGHDLAAIKAGHGEVLSIGGKRVACYRAHDDTLLAVSAQCTHLGCLVRFNQAEETWDCPCHGSRFLPSGEVIGGPAELPLKRIKITETAEPRA